MKIVATVAAAGMVVAWLSAVLAASRMTRYPAPGVSTWRLVLNGHAYFTGKGFAAEAAPHRRRFLASVAVFTALMAVVMLAAQL